MASDAVVNVCKQDETLTLCGDSLVYCSRADGRDLFCLGEV